MIERYPVAELRQLATEILGAAGLQSDAASRVAAGLVEADLYGHTTHGLALLADYVEEIDRGVMQTAGKPAVLSDLGAVACWDAGRLPGIWTTALAIEAATDKASKLGVGAVAVRRSHHIGCLATFFTTSAASPPSWRRPRARALRSSSCAPIRVMPMSPPLVAPRRC